MSSFMSISTLCLLPCVLPLTVAQLFLVRRMSVFLASEFPEDPLFILRSGWPFLVAYYIVATLVVFFLWKRSRYPGSRSPPNIESLQRLSLLRFSLLVKLVISSYSTSQGQPLLDY